MQQKYLLKKCTFELLLQTTLELLSVLENCTMVVANSWQQDTLKNNMMQWAAPSYTVCAALHVYSIKDSDMKGIASTSKNTLSLPSIFVMRQTELLLNNNLLIQVASSHDQPLDNLAKHTIMTTKTNFLLHLGAHAGTWGSLRDGVRDLVPWTAHFICCLALGPFVPQSD